MCSKLEAVPDCCYIDWSPLSSSFDNDRFELGLWADFGSRIAISDKMVRMDRLYEDTLLHSPSLKMRRSAHKPLLHLLAEMPCLNFKRCKKRIRREILQGFWV